MPYKEHVITKVYFTPGEAADLIGIATSKIRYYDGKFMLNLPKKGKKRKNQFATTRELKLTKDHIQLLKNINDLMKKHRPEYVAEVLGLKQ
jgi:DNA-binding transcriptional MerR regulator